MAARTPFLLRPGLLELPSRTGDPSLDQLCVDTIRTLSMDAVQKANSGHPGTPMALAPVAYTLWGRTFSASTHLSLAGSIAIEQYVN